MQYIREEPYKLDKYDFYLCLDSKGRRAEGCAMDIIFRITRGSVVGPDQPPQTSNCGGMLAQKLIFSIKDRSVDVAWCVEAMEQRSETHFAFQVHDDRICTQRICGKGEIPDRNWPPLELLQLVWSRKCPCWQAEDSGGASGNCSLSPWLN